MSLDIFTNIGDNVVRTTGEIGIVTAKWLDDGDGVDEFDTLCFYVWVECVQNWEFTIENGILWSKSDEKEMHEVL